MTDQFQNRPDSVWTNVAAGCVVSFRPRFVRATGTTATGISAPY